jgi:hypothetical protein
MQVDRIARVATESQGRRKSRRAEEFDLVFGALPVRPTRPCRTGSSEAIFKALDRRVVRQNVWTNVLNVGRVVLTRKQMVITCFSVSSTYSSTREDYTVESSEASTGTCRKNYRHVSRRTFSGIWPLSQDGGFDIPIRLDVVPRGIQGEEEWPVGLGTRQRYRRTYCMYGEGTEVSCH